MWSPKTIFVTGVTGYIGHNVARAFRRAGCRVLGLTRDPGRARGLLEDEIEPVLGQLQDPDTWRAEAATADILVHAAIDYAGATMQIDRAATEVLLEAAAQRGSTLIYTSGVWVHGDTGGHVADERTPLRPPALVAERVDTEQLVLQAAARGIVLRPGIVYGRRGGLTAAFFGDGPIVGSGENRWPLVHVDDLADAYVRAGERGLAGSPYIVADDTRVTVRELVAAARAAAGLAGDARWMSLEEARASMGALADALVLDQQVSAAQARRQLDWRPRHAGFVHDAALLAAANRAVVPSTHERRSSYRVS
jgi:nucleoside-diphosphate-sugar epimerase